MAVKSSREPKLSYSFLNIEASSNELASTVESTLVYAKFSVYNYGEYRIKLLV